MLNRPPGLNNVSATAQEEITSESRSHTMLFFEQSHYTSSLEDSIVALPYSSDLTTTSLDLLPLCQVCVASMLGTGILPVHALQSQLHGQAEAHVCLWATTGLNSIARLPGAKFGVGQVRPTSYLPK